MARISGMILGIGLLIVLSSLASSASAWDSDDDDDHYRYNRSHGHYHDHGHGRVFGPVYRQPLLVPRPFYRGYEPSYYPPVPQQSYYPPVPQQQSYYPPVPQQQSYYPPSPEPQPCYPPAPEPQPYYPPAEQQPIAPEPLPPDALNSGYAPNQPEQKILVPPAPPADVLPVERPGQFMDAGVVLYPHVHVKGADEVPAFAVHRILAVQSPDPRFPGCAYVQVCVPPGPCQGVKVKDGGAKIELKYGDFEVEVTSSRGIITVEYDD